MRVWLVALVVVGAMGCSQPGETNVEAGPPPVAPVPPPTEPIAASFECAKAGNDIEHLICSNYSLAALDRRLAAVYRSEQATLGALKDLAPAQRGWIKGRDECSKAEDKLQCVTEAYLTRISELQINSPDTMAANAIGHDCDAKKTVFYMAYYPKLEFNPAVATLGNDQAILFPLPTGSGAKYGRTGIEVWEHQGEVSVDYHGIKLRCKPRKAASNE